MEKECKKFFCNDLWPELFSTRYKEIIDTSRNENTNELVRFNK